MWYPGKSLINLEIHSIEGSFINIYFLRKRKEKTRKKPSTVVVFLICRKDNFPFQEKTTKFVLIILLQLGMQGSIERFQRY